MTGAGIDKKLVFVDGRARDGRLLRPLRLVEAGRAGDPDGPDRHADGDASGETALLVGGGLGNAVLFSIGAAFRARGSRVLYFAGYKSLQDRYKVEEIEHAADTVVWCCDEAPGFLPGRPQDRDLCRQYRRRDRGLWPRRAEAVSFHCRRSTASSRSARTA